MEWSAFAGECRSRGLHSLTDCDIARSHNDHGDEDTCLSVGEFVYATPGPMGEESSQRKQVILTANEVLAHLSDDEHEYGGVSMLDRLEHLGVCVSGFVSSPHLDGVRRAYDVIALEGIIEQMGGTPSGRGWQDEPNGLLQAIAVIRNTRNEIQARNVKAAQASSGPPQTGGRRG